MKKRFLMLLLTAMLGCTQFVACGVDISIGSHDRDDDDDDDDESEIGSRNGGGSEWDDILGGIVGKDTETEFEIESETEDETETETESETSTEVTPPLREHIVIYVGNNEAEAMANLVDGYFRHSDKYNIVVIR